MNIKIMCIYKITNQYNNHCYIGSTIDFKRRISTHFRLLELNTHHSLALQRAFKKYGINNFKVTIIEYVKNISNLILTEQRWLNLENPKYNMTLTAGKNCHIGAKRSQLTKNKMKKAQFGKKHSEKTKQKLRLINLGKKQTEKTKTKRIESFKKSIKFQKAIRSKERIEKIKKTRFKNGGYIVTEKQKKQISETIKNKNETSPIAKGVVKCDLNGNVIKKYRSMQEASKACGHNHGYISSKIKKGINVFDGFMWKQINKDDNNVKK